MKWRVALTALAIIATVALLLYVSAGESQKTPNATVESASSESVAKPHGTSRQREKPETKPRSIPRDDAFDGQPPKGEIQIVGRVVYTPPSDCEYVATLDALSRSISIDPLSADGSVLEGLRVYISVHDDGRFTKSISEKHAPDPESDANPALLLVPDRHFRISVEASSDTLNGQWELDAVATVRGRIVDLGEVQLPWRQLWDERVWLLTGRLVAPNGKPLGRNHDLTLMSRDLYLALAHLRTDADGRFVCRYSPPPEYVPRVPGARWELDVAGSSYMHEETWRFADGLMALPAPAVDAAQRLISFGDTTIGGSYVEMSIEPSDRAQATLKSAGPGCNFHSSVNLKNGSAERRWYLEYGRTYLVPVLPGDYSLAAGFWIKKTPALGVGSPVDLYLDSNDVKVLPVGLQHWAYLREPLCISPGEHRKLVLVARPIHEIKVLVDTPSGRPDQADYTLRYCDDEDDDFEESRAPNYPGPVVLKVQSDWRAELTVRVDGYAPVIVPVDPNANELRVRLDQPDPEATLDVVGVSSWPEELVNVTLALKLNGRVLKGATRSPDSLSDNPERFRLSAGKWTLEVQPRFGEAFPGELLCEPIEIELAPGEHRRFSLPALKAPRSLRSIDCLAFAGSSAVDGEVVGINAPEGERRIVRYPDIRTEGIFDGESVLKQQEEELEGRTKLVLRLPVRIRVTVSDTLVQALGLRWRDAISIYSRFGDEEGCNCKLIDLVNELWAPPGPCRVAFTVHGYPSFYHSWNVEISKSAVIELSSPDGFGIVNFVGERPSYSPERERDRVDFPQWVLTQKDGTEDRFVTTLDYGTSHSATLAPGEYTLRAAFGADERKEIAFSVTTGQTQEVRLPVPQPLPCNGCVLVPLPEVWTGEWRLDCDWYPSWCAHLWSDRGFYPGGPQTSYRIVEGKMRIENLPVGESFVLQLEFRSQKASKRRTWQARIDGVSLSGSEPKPLEAAWVEQK